MTQGAKEVLALLEREGVRYELVRHGAAHSIEELNALGVEGAADVAKNLFLRDDKKREYLLVTVRPYKRVDLKALRRALGSRPLSFAPDAELTQMLGLEPGAVTPFGALNDAVRRVRVVLDREFMGKRIGVHPQENTQTVFLPADELFGVLAGQGCRVEWAEIEQGEVLA
ncbi:MAG: YbaK/EbsC family protein [Candidatus Spyradocola sp.]